MDKQRKYIANLEKDKAKLNEEIKRFEKQFVSQYISLHFLLFVKNVCLHKYHGI